MPLEKLKNIKILIVEDDDMSFLYLNQIFMQTDAEIIRAKTGTEAIQLCKFQNDINLVLMDIQLPDYSGIHVTRDIRKFNPNIPIIAQTAGKTEADRQAAIQAGCNHVLIKPFNMEQLMKILLKSI